MAYRTEFVVRGDGRFPFDMLRYDHCHPVTGDDALNVGTTERDTRSVKLATIHGQKDTGPTRARWHSFGWAVVDVGLPVKI